MSHGLHTLPQLTNRNCRQVQRSALALRIAEELTHARISLLTLPCFADHVGVDQVHLYRPESDCWRTKSSSLPTFGIDASTDARLRRLGPRNAASKISRCSCSALRLCLAARCFNALTRSSDRLRTTSCAMLTLHSLCYQ